MHRAAAGNGGWEVFLARPLQGPVIRFDQEVMPVQKMLLVAALIAVSICGKIEGKTWNVPAGAPTIQAAVDSCAASGDIISIAGGVYHEGSILVNGKNISIDQSGGQVTVVAPSIGIGTCFTFRSATGGALKSLVIRGFGTAIAVENASPAVQFVSLKACNTGMTVAGASSPQFTYSIVDSCGTGIEVQAGSVTLQNNTIVHCGTGVRFLGGSTNMTRSIVYGCTTGVQCSGGGATLGCNDFFLNGSDNVGCTLAATNFFLDPKFCFWASPAGPYWLHSTSPCFNVLLNPCNVKIGAITNLLPGCTGTAVERSSWGSIKNIYR
jgi:hypothetical protein